MPYTPSDIYTNVKSLLNDSAGTRWTDTVLRQMLLIAYADCITKLQSNSIPTVLETSGAVNVAALATTVTLPADLLEPIMLSERPDGSSGNYTPMNRRMFLPERTQDIYLIDWVWIDQEIRLVGATAANEVLIKYLKDLAVLPADGDPIPILGAQSYLQYRTAALTAALRGQNYEMAEVLNLEAKDEIDQFIRVNVKNSQGTPVRRIPYQGIRNQWPSRLP